MSIRKSCADHLRAHHANTTGGKLLAGHAHELVAAFFGYGSGAALRADLKYSVEHLHNADILVPDTAMIESRISEIDGLPENLADAHEIARVLSEFLVDQGLFGGKVWQASNLANYISEQYLPEEHWHSIMDC